MVRLIVDFGCRSESCTSRYLHGSSGRLCLFSLSRSICRETYSSTCVVNDVCCIQEDASSAETAPLSSEVPAAEGSQLPTTSAEGGTPPRHPGKEVCSLCQISATDPKLLVLEKQDATTKKRKKQTRRKRSDAQVRRWPCYCLVAADCSVFGGRTEVRLGAMRPLQPVEGNP